jgi:hypothetical protein
MAISELNVIQAGLLAVAMLSGIIFMVITMGVLQSYEKSQKARPPSVNFWPFHKALKDQFPLLSRAGRFLYIMSVLASILFFVSLLGA